MIKLENGRLHRRTTVINTACFWPNGDGLCIVIKSVSVVITLFAVLRCGMLFIEQ